MDAQSYNTALTELRGVRDDIKKARAVLAKLEADRDQRITQLARHEKAKAERIAPAAGLSVADIVALAPGLAPHSLSLNHHGGEALRGGIDGGCKTGRTGSNHHHIENLVRWWRSRHPHRLGNLQVSWVLEDNW